MIFCKLFAATRWQSPSARELRWAGQVEWLDNKEKTENMCGVGHVGNGKTMRLMKNKSVDDDDDEEVR